MNQCILDILLAVQEQAQHRTQEVFDTISRDTIDDIALEFLGAEVGQALGKGLGKSRAEHDDELRGGLATICAQFYAPARVKSIARRAKGKETRTAISGLSARTYSCGGEGSRLGLGGDISLGSNSGFLSTFLWKNFRMPWRFSN